MKQSDVVKLLAPIISERTSADVVTKARLILKQLEELNLLKPTHKQNITKKDIELMPYEETIIVQGWEDENV